KSRQKFADGFHQGERAQRAPGISAVVFTPDCNCTRAWGGGDGDSNTCQAGTDPFEWYLLCQGSWIWERSVDTSLSMRIDKLR
ncbi:hypothetical protein FKZ61_018375, partial [Litorilinea aerophila]|uniref:hypothetical protein n=1 Tax=Litorilinea aerophila TaxID=1204385 RepID=UPI001B86B83D